VNSLKKHFFSYLDYPRLTLIVSLLLVLFISTGIYWIKIDDDFVKMFPDNIPSKKVWDEVQMDFGSTEYITVAFGYKNNSILNDTRAHDLLLKVCYDLEYNQSDFNHYSASPLINRIISINEYDLIEIDGKQKNVIGDYSKKLLNRFVSKNNDFISFVIVPEKDINNAILVEYVKDIVSKNIKGYEIHYAGQPYLTGEVPGVIKQDVRALMIAGFLIMLIVLILNLKSFYIVFSIVVIIFSSLFGMIGFMGWMYMLTGYDMFNFTILSTSMPIILLTIANSDGVHIASRFRRDLIKQKDSKNAISETLSKLKKPIFLTSITTSIAFLSMIFSPIPHMAGYGIVIAFGILIAWVLSVTLLPSLLIIKKWDLKSSFVEDTLIEKLMKVISNIVFRYPKRTLFVGFFIVGVSLIGIFFVKVEVNVIKFFKNGTSIRKSTDFIDNNMSGSMSFVVKIDGDFKNTQNLRDLDTLKTYIEKEFNDVNLSMSYSDIVKEINEQNALFWGVDNSDQYYRIPEDSLVLEEVLRFPVEFGGLDESDINSKIYNIIDTLSYNKGLIVSTMKTISTQKATSISNKVNERIDDMMIDGNLKFSVTGLLVFLKDFVSMVVQSSITSIAVSLFIISIISVIFFKKIYWMLLSVVPLVSAIILNFGFMGILGVELSHLTALLTSVIIGVGVDFAIHYISFYRKKYQEICKKNQSNLINVNLLTSKEVGYPILLDVFSNMGFIALIFSAIIPINYMGGLMVFAMFSTSFGTLTIMSALIEITKDRFNY